MTLFRRSISSRGAAAFAGEVFLIAGSIAIALHLNDRAASADGLWWKAAATAALWQLVLYYNDFYDLTLVHSSRELIVRLLQGAGAAAIVLAGLYALVPALDLGSRVILTSLLLFLVAVLGWRLLLFWVAGVEALEERLLFVGTGGAARTVARQIAAQRDFPYRVVGFVDDEPAGAGDREGWLLGNTTDIPRLVEQYAIDRIVVGLADRRGRLPVQELMQAKLSGIRVEDATATYERITGKLLVDNLRPSWLIFSEGFRVSAWTRLVKRAFDLALAGAGLVIASPLLVLAAQAIWIEDGFPVIYRQQRAGRNGRPFTLYKFRSMRHDAEGETPVWAADADPRVTAVGRALRTTRLDELPQLWNVLRGDMSFVGPRPERPFFVAQLAAQIPFYEQRHAVRPGITGWAQVKYRYGASVEDALEKLRYDLYYIKHLSIGFDVTILVDTVKVILFGKGAK
ncbi:MAG TPA: TIGR03013 family PEP-CTERM/XrtA system glycosyltransferase [Vicinamibacterales bacterium]|nr:TIGR03013 family PEP-CTERM/XrtA system glycosyltransferase [Acidobacteriota bacterium]HOC17064.1 TIGR03013 family PEP-CTERM/XrtA system glycosyltransferase [Vicinamibacterales bacterium]